ncbi:MAG: AAA family ATPase [Bacteroidota bacterium]
MAATPTVSEQFTRTTLAHIHEYISGQGFFYAKQDIANFFLALKTKPFVILSGISGSGKTQLVRQFAAALGYADHCTLIPVGADWTDSTDLLGYQDLQGNFRTRPLLDTILAAYAQPEAPFFAILDEMNLARVEYFMGDLLSVMETRCLTDQRIHTDALLGPSHLGEQGQAELGHSSIGLPDNLYLIGTINVDESTHPLSRKVLDRANVIEMSQVRLDWPSHEEEIPPAQGITNAFLRASYVHLKDVPLTYRKRVDHALLLLQKINARLQEADLAIGYRVRDEFIFYLLARHEIRELISTEEALDFQLMQKILPRIQGSTRRIRLLLDHILKELYPTALSSGDLLAAEEWEELFRSIPSPAPTFPKSVTKLLMMIRRYEEDGYTSFWL